MWNWLSLTRSRVLGARQARPARFAVETLETRCLLSAVVWDPDGNGGTDAMGNAFDSTPPPDSSLVQEGSGAAGGSPSGNPEALDLTQTFLLNSLAGANQTIYLDFNGAVTSGTSWNSSFTGGADIVTPAYDTDGNPSAFSDAELANIQYIWQRVAEDYAPFNVNVTTQDPGIEALRKTSTSDTQWGIRVVIGGNGSWYGSAGGVTYVGSFNWNSDTPAFVFPGQLGNGAEKYTAEAISHEVGHSLGLSHDGTSTSGYYSGSNGWAPIMGVGYYQDLVQFSKGEYAGANNTQDDLAIITTQNGFGYRPDDYGSTLATASPLSTAGGSVAANGIIEQNTDADVFSFYTGSGAINFNVVPADRGPNLNIQASLYDANGNLIQTNNPTGVLSASLSATVPQGQYFLKVEGTGEGDPLNGGYSDYGSLGQYWITGTVVDAGSVPSLSVSSVSVNESAGTATFRLALAAPATQALTVGYQTVDGTALAGSDYVATSGTVTFQAGEFEKFVTVSIINDTVSEPTESFGLTVSPANGQAVLVTQQGTGTIVDDDAPIPVVSVNSVSKNEGNPNKQGVSSSTPFTFTISLSQAVSTAVTVSYATADGTAVAGSDYAATSGSVTFAAGQTSATVTVTVFGDGVVEADETFSLTLTGTSGGSIGQGVGTGTIVNDDTTSTNTTTTGNGKKPAKAAVIGEEYVARTGSATTDQVAQTAGQPTAHANTGAADFTRAAATPAATVSALLALAVDVQAPSFGSSPPQTQAPAREQSFASVYDLLLAPAGDQKAAIALDQVAAATSDEGARWEDLFSFDR